MRWGYRIRKREGLFADSFCCYRKSEKFVTVKSSIETDGQPTNLPLPLYGALYKWRRYGFSYNENAVDRKNLKKQSATLGIRESN